MEPQHHEQEHKAPERNIPTPSIPFPAGHIDPDDLAVDLRIAVMRTSRRLRTQATGDVVSPGQYSVLSYLRSGTRTLRELADRENVQAPSMTRIVNALTEQGFVDRAPDPTDGRQVLIRILPAGEGAVEEARGQRTAWLACRVAELAEPDRATLSRAAQLMQEMSAR